MKTYNNSSKETITQTSLLTNDVDENGISNSDRVIDQIYDSGLLGYNFHKGLKIGENIKNIPSSIVFNDSSNEFKDNSIQTANIQMANSYSQNARWQTFNIPLIDYLSRNNPFLRKAVNYLSSKPLINGIDINIKHDKLSSDDIFKIQDFANNLYLPFKNTLSKGITYGGSAGLIWFEKESIDDLEKPIIIRKIRSKSYKGIKVLSRWFQIEPKLDGENALVSLNDISRDGGFDDAKYIGTPKYYNINLSGSLMGDGKNRDIIVHASRVLIFSAELASYIETQVERYWGPSKVELVWNDLINDRRLWSATTKSAEKNNMGVLKLKGLSLSGLINAHSKKVLDEKLGLIKEGSSNNILPIDAEDDFEFVNSAFSGQGEILKLSNSRYAGAYNVPTSVLFPTENADKDERYYIQSLSELQDTQERVLKDWYKRMLSIYIKSEFNITIEEPMFSFNPIETQTLKEKADMFKVMTDGLKNLYDIGVVDGLSAINMLDDIVKDPTNISQNIINEYRDKLVKDAKQGIIYNKSYVDIELAKNLNQLQGDDEIGGGLSGIRNPESDMGGKNNGGNPKQSKRLLKIRDKIDEKLIDIVKKGVE